MSFMVFPVYSELTIGIRMDPVGQRNAESIANSMVQNYDKKIRVVCRSK